MTYLMSLVIPVIVVIHTTVAALTEVSYNCTSQQHVPGCTARCNELGDTVSIMCSGGTLTSLPETTPAESMRIEHNNIDILQEVPYDDTVHYLYLPSNKIRFITDGAFDKLTELKTLSLANNSISSIRRTTFNGIQKLHTLVISGNPLYEIYSDTFDNAILPQLAILDMNRCKLYKVGEKFIESMSNLMSLTMAHNNLRELPIIGCPGHSLDKLATWDLSHNAIEDIEVSGCHMANISYLDLSYNKLQALRAHFLGSSVEFLKMLNLEHNEISTIDNNAFNGSKQLNTIHLPFNKLVRLNSTSIPWTQVKHFFVHDNPWDCSCDNEWLVTQAQVIESNTNISMRCASPPKLANQSVFGIHQIHLKKKCMDPNHSHVLGTAIGVIVCIISLAIGCLVFYRLVTRKKATQDNAPLQRQANATQFYSRMHNENEFGLDDHDNNEIIQNNRPASPVWKNRGPVKDDMEHFSI